MGNWGERSPISGVIFWDPPFRPAKLLVTHQGIHGIGRDTFVIQLEAVVLSGDLRSYQRAGRGVTGGKPRRL